MFTELRTLLRFVGIVAVGVLALLVVYRLLFGGRKRAARAAAGRLATEVRCEQHGIRLRLEAATPPALDQARCHVQCPLCALQSARDVR